MDSKNFFRLLSWFHILVLSYISVAGSNGKVRVKIYDHRAYHDPIGLYGRGPWKYFGHGYGIDYGYDHDGNKSHEKGYGFIKAFAREFCKHGYGCRPPDPNFWKMASLSANGLSPEPYFARPPSDVMEPTISQPLVEPKSLESESNPYSMKNILQTNKIFRR